MGGGNEGFGECHHGMAVKIKIFNGEIFIDRTSVSIDEAWYLYRRRHEKRWGAVNKVARAQRNLLDERAVRLSRNAGDGPRIAAGKNVNDKKNFCVSMFM